MAEAALLKKLEELVKDSNSVSGRDASVISAEASEIEKEVQGGKTKLSAAGRKKAQAALDEIAASVAFEKNSGNVIKYATLICTVLPMLLTGVGTVQEWALRPAMVVAKADLTGWHAVVTGGCGAVGFELAVMLASSGAGVVLGCHGVDASQSGSEGATARVEQLGLRRTEEEGFSFEPDEQSDGTSRGWIEVWPLRLESFASVRHFASRVAALSSVELLVHNAATKHGCSLSEDGHELATQVNYLSPFLLTRLLLPSLSSGGRIVHLACDAGLQLPDYLPWPLRRTSPEALPRVRLDDLDVRTEGKEAGSIAGHCSAPLQYASAKLALVVHTAELHRRLSVNRTGVTSLAVNPGAMANDFYTNEPPAPTSVRGGLGFLRGLSFPPVWIARKLYGALFVNVARTMLRATTTGAQAAFHVATAAALTQPYAGGGLYSDQAGAFSQCGRAAELCGRMAAREMPAAAADPQLAKKLWARTEQAIGATHLRPLESGEAGAIGEWDAAQASDVDAGRKLPELDAAFRLLDKSSKKTPDPDDEQEEFF